jgi:hypothetical protein
MPQWLPSLLNFLAAGSSVISAIYWQKASMINLPPIDPITNNPTGSVSIRDILATLKEGEKANKFAARLTALSAALAGVSALL